MKIRIKLENGLEFEKVLDNKQIKKAENHKMFKKISRQNAKDNEKQVNNQLVRWKIDWNAEKQKRLDDLQIYYNFVANL